MWSRNTTLIFAVVFAAVGILGFVPAFVTMPAGGHDMVMDGMHGLLFGLFPVNWLHNLVHLGFGLWAFFAYFSGIDSSRFFLKATAVIYAVLTVMGLIPGLNTLFGLVPLYGHDIWLHALIAIVAGGVGFFVDERDTAREAHSTRV
ncbi:DUF4383 domain-containing protein [Azospirillum halopraeferens]|uniref:DUF4383 domain-containing protein n=1 Tax=Azospirillum halopraeferens TaxID=34010 RepID=UPI00042714AD|nr:DUF4383 domain-containing protein [Azospirillum halopraeferens]